jgi:hypothetical protein
MRHRAAILSLLAGLAVIAVARLAAPLASPPLYDGVVVQDPYRYLVPGSNQAGSPTSATLATRVEGTTSPQFAVATTESPPQAQLISAPGAFVLPAGVASVTASIEAVPATAPPTSGQIAGNVYRFSVADESGAPLAVGQAAGTQPTLVLRAPDGVSTATIARLDGAAWQELPTEAAGQPGMFVTTVTALGDFAVIAGPAPGLLGLDPGILVAVGVGVGVGVAALLAVVALAVLVSRRQRQAPAVHAPSPSRRPRPSKRRSGGRRRGGSR